MKYRVLHILGELKYSGAEVMLKVAKTKFNDADIETHILSTGKVLGEFSAELIDCNYILKHIPFHKSINYIISIYNFLKKEQFDVIHIHTERFFFIYILIAKILGTKKILRTIHSTFNFEGWLGFRRNKMLKLGNKLGCKYLAISKNVQENELLNNNISSILINNWIDTDYFKPINKQEFNSDTNIIKLISVGSCSEVKQHFHIINIVSILKKMGEKVSYIHLGSGELENHEKKLSEDLKIDDHISFNGNQSDILPFLLKCDFFLMPSQYEGLGNSCLEAMSTGLIPIVNNVSGLKDLVKDQHDGIVIDYKNEKLVAKTIIELSKNKKLNAALKLNARQKILNQFGLSNIEKLKNLYINQ